MIYTEGCYREVVRWRHFAQLIYNLVILVSDKRKSHIPGISSETYTTRVVLRHLRDPRFRARSQSRSLVRYFRWVSICMSCFRNRGYRTEPAVLERWFIESWLVAIHTNSTDLIRLSDPLCNLSSWTIVPGKQVVVSRVWHRDQMKAWPKMSFFGMDGWNTYNRIAYASSEWTSGICMVSWNLIRAVTHGVLPGGVAKEMLSVRGCLFNAYQGSASSVGGKEKVAYRL